ncbi:hypothetical protein J4471_01220 [Candidatus Woesearchaeota archaeon]|nr:hypothetical protein [Candidatus Woesearchaeota archaeon]
MYIDKYLEIIKNKSEKEAVVALEESLRYSGYSEKFQVYKELVKKDLDSGVKSELRKNFIKMIKANSQVKLKTGTSVELHMGYDSISEGLEPIYFWFLEFLRSDSPSGLGLDVNKVEEAFEASASSSYFGEMGTRAGVMQDRAMRILSTINTVIRSIINLIYDLKEFEIRLQTYDQMKSDIKDERDAAEIALKGVWLDQVDLLKHGRGSINSLTQQLQFVTLRDAFFVATTKKEVDNLDLNERVRNILIRKLDEYSSWKSLSEKELRKRYNIERAYLKSQIDSMKLYTKWARPYLRASQQLGMKEFNSPHIVAAFNNVQMELSLFAKKEIKPDSVNETFGKLKFENKYFACLEINFQFRSVPQVYRGREATQYVHGGMADIYFRPYVFTNAELTIIEEQELYEDMDLVENLTNVSMKELQNDLDKYLKSDPKESEITYIKVQDEKGNTKYIMKPTKKKKKPYEWPFKNIDKKTKEKIKPFKIWVRDFFGLKEKQGFAVNKIRDEAQSKALGYANTAYDIYKKSHGMVSW